MLCKNGGVLLNINPNSAQVTRMRYLIILIAFCAGTAANAGCYADYKAKQDGPLKLHYGVMSIDDAACSTTAATSVVQSRLAAHGWTLLTLLSVSKNDPTPQQKANAGDFFLRY